MTSFSLRIYYLPDGCDRASLDSSSFEAPIARSLDAHAERCGPYGLQAWASRRDLPLHFVDNCWVRAVVRGEDLRSFFQDVLGVLAPASSEFGPAAAYVIEAEEF